MAKKKEEPEIVELTEVEASSLLDRLQASNLDEKDNLGMQLTPPPTTCSISGYEYLPQECGRIDGFVSE